ncbi:MAG: multiheme c-type cytochrome [Candidatus Zixiibacteriota bacterium]
MHRTITDSNKRYLKSLLQCTIIFLFILIPPRTSAQTPVSEQTAFCIDCHASVTPGIVADWRASRHAGITPAKALVKPDINRRISVKTLPDSLAGFAVGCAECHTLKPNTHADSFEHNDFQVHIVVTPADCATCHPEEWTQYQDNLMSMAHDNLKDNPLYETLVASINGLQHFSQGVLTVDPPLPETDDQSCYFCHGTVVEIAGMETRETDLGDMTFPVLTGWPNPGVGRVNPDDTRGSCTSCHARHEFSVAVARKPYTCSECHKGPDVPAYKVYEVSKHGNIYSSKFKDWDFTAVPWVLGEDFTAPTCAVCHASLVTDSEGQVVSERTHRMNDRLDTRLFGLVYAHPHPESSNTSIITNKSGLPLPTELTGEPAMEFLIDSAEQAVRQARMKKVCRSCHSQMWVDGHFDALKRVIEETNAMTLTATRIMRQIWRESLAEGLPQGKSIFDEAIEKMWVEQWLFYANSTRFSAAMSGADYGVFADGRWAMSKNIQAMHDWLGLRQQLRNR